MANTIDFMGAVFDELARLLNISSGTSGAVMQMAWPALSLSRQDFTRSGMPDAPYDPEVAQETFSLLANIEPTLDRSHYENSGFEVADLYELLISGAIPTGTTQATIGSNPTFKLFTDAQFEFMQARRGTHNDPNAFYYPCTATPAGWYDEVAAQSWSSLTLKSTDVKPVNPTSPFVKGGGAAIASQSVWKLRPTLATSEQIKTPIQRALRPTVQPSAVLVPKRPGADAIHAITARPTAAAAALGTIGMASADKPILENRANVLSGSARFTEKAVPVSVLTKSDLSKQIDHIDLTQKRLELGGGNIGNRLYLQGLINKHLPVAPPSNTDGFSITFKYSRVNIERHWLKLALLNTRNWYMLDTKEGEYSSGTDEDNRGMFPLLPLSFIAIRDLRITANWSQVDRQNIANAAAFGFFDIRNSTLNADTLVVDGLYIAGWISRVTPKLPPLPSP